MAGIVPVIGVAEGLTALHRRGLFLAALSKQPYDMVINIIVGPVLAAGIVLATLLCSRVIDRRPVRDFGAVPDRRWLADWLFGAALGAGLMAGIFLLEYGLGWVRIVPGARLDYADASLGLCIGFTLTKALCVGVYEEFVSRGYHLRNLAEALYRDRAPLARRPVLLAALVSSALFALMHASTANISALSLVGLFSNGFLLASGILCTGRLGLCIGLHSGWNFFEGAVFGFPVSGDLEPGSLLRLDPRGPGWITGGAYGPEGGLVGILATAAGIAAVAGWARARYGSAAVHIGIGADWHRGDESVPRPAATTEAWDPSNV